MASKRILPKIAPEGGGQLQKLPNVTKGFNGAKTAWEEVEGGGRHQKLPNVTKGFNGARTPWEEEGGGRLQKLPNVTKGFNGAKTPWEEEGGGRLQKLPNVTKGFNGAKTPWEEEDSGRHHKFKNAAEGKLEANRAWEEEQDRIYGGLWQREDGMTKGSRISPWGTFATGSQPTYHGTAPDFSDAIGDEGDTLLSQMEMDFWTHHDKNIKKCLKNQEGLEKKTKKEKMKKSDMFPMTDTSRAAMNFPKLPTRRCLVSTAQVPLAQIEQDGTNIWPITREDCFNDFGVQMRHVVISGKSRPTQKRESPRFI